MKLINRKRRKLDFIRKKNDLNNGKPIFCNITMSQALQEDPRFDEILKEQIQRRWNSVKRVYRLKFEPSRVATKLGKTGLDHIRNSITCKITFAK